MYNIKTFKSQSLVQNTVCSNAVVLFWTTFRSRHHLNMTNHNQRPEFLFCYCLLCSEIRP